MDERPLDHAHDVTRHLAGGNVLGRLLQLQRLAVYELAQVSDHVVGVERTLVALRSVRAHAA